MFYFIILFRFSWYRAYLFSFSGRKWHRKGHKCVLSTTRTPKETNITSVAKVSTAESWSRQHCNMYQRCWFFVFFLLSIKKSTLKRDLILICVFCSCSQKNFKIHGRNFPKFKNKAVTNYNFCMCGNLCEWSWKNKIQIHTALKKFVEKRSTNERIWKGLVCTGSVEFIAKDELINILKLGDSFFQRLTQGSVSVHKLSKSVQKRRHAVQVSGRHEKDLRTLKLGRLEWPHLVQGRIESLLFASLPAPDTFDARRTKQNCCAHQKHLEF